MPESYYDHHPDLPDDYWDEVDYKFSTTRQKKFDMEPDGDPYEERKLREREEEESYV